MFVSRVDGHILDFSNSPAHVGKFLEDVLERECMCVHESLCINLCVCVCSIALLAVARGIVPLAF